jgi:hypothetical protein
VSKEPYHSNLRDCAKEESEVANWEVILRSSHPEINASRSLKG